eukprot:gene13414-15806_t
MDIVYIFLIIVVIGLLSSFIKKNTRFSNQDVPAPFIELPLIGSLHRLGSMPHRTLVDVANKHGPAFSLWLGDCYTVVLSDPALIRSVWVKNFESFNNRPQTPTFAILSGGFVNLTLARHELWKRNRENVAHVFTKTKLKQNAKDVINRNAAFLINKMKEFEVTKEPFQPDLYMKKYAFNVILNMGFSVDIPYGESVSEGILGDLVEPIEAVILAAGTGNLFDYFSSIAPLYLAYKRLTNTPVDKILQVIRRIHQEHLDTIDRENPRDILDQLIISYPDPCDLLTILTISFDMFIAGTETSASTLCWFILRLVNNPSVMEKAYAEVSDVVGRDRLATVDDRVNTPYLAACIKEVLRMTPIVPLGIPRVAKEDIILEGKYFIPKNTQILQNQCALHNDGNYWVDPDVYMPERFVGNNHSEYWMPFSLGQRNCVGVNLALDELYVACANIVLKYKFTEANGKASIDDTEKFGVTISPLARYSIILESR